MTERLATTLLAAVLAVFGCQQSGQTTDGDTGLDAAPMRDGDGGDGTFPEDVGDNRLPDGDTLIDHLEVVPNPSNMVSTYVEWETTVPATTKLSVRCGNDWKQSYRADGMGTDHSVFVMGLWPEARCKAVAAGTTESGERAAAATTFQVAARPEHLPDFTVEAHEPDRRRRGWTMFNLWNGYDNRSMIAAMVDARGRYRWYHRLSVDDPGAGNDIELYRGSPLIGGTPGGVRPQWLNWEGDVLWEKSLAMHHEIEPRAEGDVFLYLGYASGCSDLQYDGKAIIAFDRERDREVDRWEFCDYYGPSERVRDWDHLNTIEPFPDEPAVLVSSLRLHSIFKINLERRELEWQMGIDGDFDISEDERFFRQHAPSILENGNILLFDNGSLRRGTYSRPWSRALELSYDVSSKQVEIAWQYRPDPDFFAPIWGDADRLDNGNSLITFGVRNKRSNKNSRIVEVTADKEVVWRLDAPNKWGWYRSMRVTDLPTGYVVDDR